MILVIVFIRKDFFEFTPDFDFFNYAGILRSVYLIKLPNAFISDLHIIADDKGKIEKNFDKTCTFFHSLSFQ